MKYLYLTLALFFVLACNQKEKTKSITEGGMKCGAGKCGASMGDSSSALGKKQMNILKQLNKNDPRTSCVKKAPTIKALYACVRDAKTGRLKVKYEGNTPIKTMKSGSKMKCAVGKCGG